MSIFIKPTSVPAHRLAESIVASSTSFKADSILGWNAAALTSADFGTKLYVSFRNSTGTRLELMEVDPATITAASSPITILRRGLKFTGDRTTEVTANKLTWVKGDTIIQFGSDVPQMFQTLIEYIDAVVIAGMIDASTTQQGALEVATQAEVYSRATSGGTSAPLGVIPSTLPSVLLHDQATDTGAADAYVIAPTPAITAYVTGQRFSFKAVNANTGASTLAVNGLAAKSIKKLDGSTALALGDIKAGQAVIVEYDGTNFQMVSPLGSAYASVKFGGTGADGALAITSGVTTIDCANAAVVVKNYTSISITGTGSLAFSNPSSAGTLIILKSQGNVTLTSSTAPMISTVGMGAAGGTGGTAPGGGSDGNPGTSGTAGFVAVGTVGAGGGSAFASGGAVGAAASPTFYKTSLVSKFVPFVVGSGGGGASGCGSGGGSGGNGGRGGGALYIECGGALNFTTASGISTAGAPGSTPGQGGGGGGGGGAGSCVILYNTLTASSGTVTTTGGAGSAGDNGGGSVRGGGGGGGGGSYSVGIIGTAGGIGTQGQGGAGGNGGAGYSLIAQNIDFA